ncbi:protein inscuteable homolog [Pyrgilauda ruficollis]|uniref:protein inscuteable homolog n=1 Tax=Pyrgilauda ruficollis TaxID=221976 RepID=UPI001B875C35|nr:protein inscuteable homolog [Pyrgilauda ruficollis]
MHSTKQGLGHHRCLSCVGGIPDLQWSPLRREGDSECEKKKDVTDRTKMCTRVFGDVLLGCHKEELGQPGVDSEATQGLPVRARSWLRVHSSGSSSPDSSLWRSVHENRINMAFKGEDHLDSLSFPVQRMHLIQVDSVQRWMEDLKLMTDCECMCILQSKPISIEKDEQNELILSSQHSSCDNLQLLLKRAWIISTELTRIAQKLEKNRWQRVHSMTVRVNCHVHSMVNEYNAFTRSSSEEMHQLEKLLIDKCSEFTAFTERCLQTEDEEILKTMKSCVNETLTTVAQYFGQLIELVLTQEAQNLLRQVELSGSLYVTESAISSLFSLAQEGAHLCRIIAKEGGVVALFKICRQDCFRCLYPQTLRTLASICCVEEGMHQLEKVDGILCLADILTDTSHSEATHAEAAAVIAQITSPHLTFTQHLSSFLENMEEIVTALVVTILANMSVLDQCASEIIQGNGVQLLMEMLFEKSSSGNPAEAAACERVQQKSAVTLARLSRDPEVAEAAVKLSCIPRLIKLCRSPTERNNSDSVLVACLAALRRLAVMSPDGLEDSDFQQLVKPRLVDSFLLCTNMEESFV